MQKPDPYPQKSYWLSNLNMVFPYGMNDGTPLPSIRTTAPTPLVDDIIAARIDSESAHIESISRSQPTNRSGQEVVLLTAEVIHMPRINAKIAINLLPVQPSEIGAVKLIEKRISNRPLEAPQPFSAGPTSSPSQYLSYIRCCSGRSAAPNWDHAISAARIPSNCVLSAHGSGDERRASRGSRVARAAVSRATPRSTGIEGAKGLVCHYGFDRPRSEPPAGLGAVCGADNDCGAGFLVEDDAPICAISQPTFFFPTPEWMPPAERAIVVMPRTNSAMQLGAVDNVEIKNRHRGPASCEAPTKRSFYDPT